MSDIECDAQNISIASASHANTSTANVVQCVELQSVPYILSGKYFSLVSNITSTRGLISARCQFCLPKITVIKSRLESTSVFIAHLKQKHSTQFEEYNLESANKTPTLMPISMGRKKMKKKRQNLFLIDVTKFFISEMIPLNAVEDTYFRLIFKYMDVSDKINALSVHTLERTINELYTNTVCDLKNELNAVKYASTVVKSWSHKRRFFLGVTAHWISRNYERKSATLAYRRLASEKSSNTNNDMLKSIYKEFRLCNLRLGTVISPTSSNCVTDLRMFGVKESVIAMEDEDNLSSEEEEGMVGENTPVDPDYMDSLPFPPRVCSTYALHVYAIEATARTLNDNEVLFGIHSGVIQKCNALWEAVLKPKSAEIIEAINGHTLKRPSKSSWYSLYESLKQILQIKDRMPELAQLLGMTSVLSESDFTYLEEHIKCTAPIAEALDILEEGNAFYGAVLPCLLCLRTKLTNLAKSKWIFCEPISSGLSDIFETRFQNYLNFNTALSDNAAMAALTHPQYRNKWFNCINEEQRGRLISLLGQAIREEIKTTNECIVNEPSSSSRHDRFSTLDASEQIFRFFNESGTGFDILQSYGTINKLFLKHNCPLTSWTVVEKLYPYTTVANSPNWSRLSDSLFQEIGLLKANLEYLNET